MKFSMAYFRKGHLAFSMENYEEAIECYTKSIRYNPGQEMYYRHRATAYLKLLNYEAAKYDTIKALQIGSHGLNHHVKLRLWLYRGICCYQLGTFKEAQRAFLVGKALGCENLEIGESYDAWLKQCETKLRGLSVYTWSQSETDVIVTIPVTNAKLENVTVPFNSRTLRCVVENNDKVVVCDLRIDLEREINVVRSSCLVGSSICITMEKLAHGMWETLERLRGDIGKPGTSTNQNSDGVAAEWIDTSGEYEIEFTEEQEIEFELAVDQFVKGLSQTSPEQIENFFLSLGAGNDAYLYMKTATMLSE